MKNLTHVRRHSRSVRYLPVLKKVSAGYYKENPDWKSAYPEELDESTTAYAQELVDKRKLSPGDKRVFSEKHKRVTKSGTTLDEFVRDEVEEYLVADLRKRGRDIYGEME